MVFKATSEDNFLIPNEEYSDLQDAIFNIISYLEIIEDYCEQNMEYSKIYPLLIMFKHLNEEKKRITSKF